MINVPNNTALPLAHPVHLRAQVPLLSMQQSVLLCISTILDSGNHYTKMMELVDDYGNTVFETIKITLVR